MGGQVNHRRIHTQNPPDSPEEIEQWARDLIRAIGKRRARTILEDYKRLADDRKLTKFDRSIAEQRRKVLAKLL